MKFGVVTFPGSNSDYDSFTAVRDVLKEDVEFLWHQSADLNNCDVIILPGGFAYGDYLRAGAIARFSPIMAAIVKFANSGGMVMGICNGFQVLTEAGLLPGALLRNSHLRFSGRPVYMKVENNQTAFTSVCNKGDLLKVPVAHGEGNYYHFGDKLAELEENSQVVFRYADRDGNLTDQASPNGSLNSIAGIINREGNVMGLMPHPERAVESILGSADGLKVFESIRATLGTRSAVLN